MADEDELRVDYLTSYKEHFVDKSKERSVEKIFKKGKGRSSAQNSNKKDLFGEKCYLTTLRIFLLLYYLLRYLLLITLLCYSFSLVSAIIIVDEHVYPSVFCYKNVPLYYC